MVVGYLLEEIQLNIFQFVNNRMSKSINVALIGNPNTGKSSVFNDLTGLNQKVGNYPGITAGVITRSITGKP